MGKEFNRRFSEADTQVATKHEKTHEVFSETESRILTRLPLAATQDGYSFKMKDVESFQPSDTAGRG